MRLSRFSLAGPIGRGQLMIPDDIRRTKFRLAELGYDAGLDSSPIERPDERLFEAIAHFQRDSGLTVDGFMRPGGETELGLRRISGDGEPEQKYGRRSPIYRCWNIECRGPHGGSKGVLCPSCDYRRENGDKSIRIVPPGRKYPPRGGGGGGGNNGPGDVHRPFF